MQVIIVLVDDAAPEIEARALDRCDMWNVAVGVKYI